MSQRFFVWIEYDGTAYHGWQIQPNGVTVQQKLNECLSVLLKEPVETTGAGRTDTGVHARNFAAHFHSPHKPELENLKGLTYKLNCMLPHDISVKRIEPVKNNVHARFSAISRTYHYYIHRSKDPFLVNRSWFVGQELDVTAMHEASKVLLDHDNFQSFSKSNSGTTNFVCQVKEAKWFEEEKNLRFEITADRFLRNMVRAIVGTLVEVGLGKISLEEFNKIIELKNRSRAGTSVPACGLYLQEIEYPGGYIMVGNSK